MKQHDKGAVKQYRQVWLWLVLWVAFLPYVQAEGIITTVAGNGTGGFSGDGGHRLTLFLTACFTGVSAKFHDPEDSGIPKRSRSIDYLILADK